MHCRCASIMVVVTVVIIIIIGVNVMIFMIVITSTAFREKNAASRKTPSCLQRFHHVMPFTSLIIQPAYDIAYNKHRHATVLLSSTPPLLPSPVPRGGGTASATPLRKTPDRKSTRLNSSHIPLSRMPSSA